MFSNFVEIVCFTTFSKNRYFLKEAANFPCQLSTELTRPVGGMGHSKAKN